MHPTSDHPPLAPEDGALPADVALFTVLVPAAWLGGAVVGALDTLVRGGAALLAARAAILVGGVAVWLALVELAGAALFIWTAGRLVTAGWRRPSANAFVGAVLAAPVGAWLLAALFSGRRLAIVPGRPILLMAGLLALLALTFTTVAAASAGFPWPQRRRLVNRHGLALGLGLVGAIPGLLWLDGHLLARRYSWFHLVLEVATLGAAQLGLVLVSRPWRWTVGRWRLRLAGGLALVASLAMVATANRLWGAGAEHDRAQIFSRGGVVATLLDHLRVHSVPAPSPTGAEPWAPVRVGAGPFAGSDVVLVTVDALRADHLGLYGYRRPTSPRLDALARESTVFERAYSPSPHTSFAIASMLTGRNAFPLARANLVDAVPTLPDAFARAGYHTVGLFPPAVFFVEGERFGGLERRRYGFAEVRFESLEETRDASVRTDQAIEVLRRRGDRPLFMWVHYFGPHEPYVGHTEAGDRFGPKEMDRYDDEIAWVDREVGRLLDHLQSRPRPAIVVLTADHGEEFSDHGGAYHGTSLYDEQIRVPLVVRVPGGAPRRVPTAVSTIDVAPTLLGLAAVPWTAPLDGVDRQPEVLGRPEGRPARPVFAEVESWKAAMVDRRKLICDVARDFCLLFDLTSDPAEKVDLAPRRRREVGELRRELEGWLKRSPPAEAPAGEAELEAHRGLALDRDGHREEAIGRLAEALPGITDVNLRCRVLAALGRARDPRATAALLAAYDHIRSRICVSEALGGARDPAAIPFLTARLKDDPYTTVRASVARALGLTGDRAALPALLEVFQRDTEEVVVAAAARALADLGAALSLGGARLLQRPPSAKELWLVTAPGRPTPRVRLAKASGSSLRAELYTSVARDAHAFTLPPNGGQLLWVSKPAQFALFR